MNFQIVDTEAAYRRLLAATDEATRGQIFDEELIAPFAGMVQIFGGDGRAAFAQWGMRPEQFANERERITATLATLAEHHLWERAAGSLEQGWAAFEPYAQQIGLGKIVFGLYLADLSGMPLERGYSGFGGLPGYIMTIYDQPNEHNLARVEACTVHELHHNVRFRLFPFLPMTATVGEYLVAEGLAESFAAERYGADSIGPWVTEFDEAQLEPARAVLGAALEQSGFNLIRSYIFGDTIAKHMGLQPMGVPDYAGYALGYKVVQAYLRNTGSDVAKATFVPAQEIIAQSEFFRAA
jgi:uncharacterized protein YjaZ